MADECNKLDCCTEGEYGYNLPSLKPQPPALETVTLTVDQKPGGVINPGTSQYTKGTYVTVTAKANEGHEFTGWDGDLFGTENPTQIYMDGDKQIEGTFALKTYLVAAKSDPGGAGTITGNGSYYHGDTASVEITPDPGFIFNGWTGEINSSDNPVEFEVTQDVNLIANLVEETAQLTIQTNPEGAGSPVGAGSYFKGAVVDIYANPKENFCFEYWSGDISSTDDPASVTMSSNKTVIANYSELVEFEYIWHDEVSQYFPISVNALGPLIFNWELTNPPDSQTAILIRDQDDNVLYSSPYLYTNRSGVINTGYTITLLKVTIDITGTSHLPYELRTLRINSSCIP